MNKKPNKIRTTKYTAISFVPLNLYHQFTKVNNIFFLITLIMLCIPSVSPFTPFSYLIAFSIIMMVSMIKDATEDLRRRNIDKQINERICLKINGNYFANEGNSVNRLEKVDLIADYKKNTIFFGILNDERYECVDQNNFMNSENDDNVIFSPLGSENKGLSIIETKVEDIMLGDFVLVREDEEVPADILLLGVVGYDAKTRGYCFVETSGLDGESNLKRKLVAEINTPHSRYNILSEIMKKNQKNHFRSIKHILKIIKNQ
ncbi:HAD ATPase, P-type, family IC [Edhazardia aedis USNM 41457]|uniref:HAD ATPase, P-type, family IC n=1 Tax=Edhazardia aedis (strain USNM 41457) TaxID=1003232 RepID=J8ZNK1_EDHAE|nr:HAD ATPase, P-type, family IC [Edhazardia aedis USNM 41457]|eukprot:EJW01263.1 HAD ATPase, P-type, family IC [Edhazardia aedis USNM 41457]